jgi:hypothetical protein
MIKVFESPKFYVIGTNQLAYLMRPNYSKADSQNTVVCHGNTGWQRSGLPDISQPGHSILILAIDGKNGIFNPLDAVKPDQQ